MNRKRSYCQRVQSTSSAIVDFETEQLVPEDTFEQSFSENDADFPSSSAIIVDSKKIKLEEKDKENRAPFQEIVKNARRNSTRSRLSPSDTCSSGSDKEDDKSPIKEMGQHFRRFSQELHKKVGIFECNTPTMLTTMDMGSPKKVWSVLCAKDDLNDRDWSASAHDGISYKMRLIVLDWMNEVCTDRRLHRESFHLAVDYFDRFLKVETGISCAQLQLVATAALIIATKIEEIYPPKVHEICDYSDGGVTVEQSIKMEQIMLVKLNWNFNPITSIHWLSLYCQLLAKSIEDVPRKLKRRSPALKLNFDESFNDENNYDSQATTTTISEDSFLNLIDGEKVFDTSLNESLSLNEMNTTYSDGHLVVNENVTVPKLMREEFCYLAKIIDYITMSEYFLKFKYGDIAAAVLFCTYEPTKLVEDVTGKVRSDLIEIIDLIQFFVDYCDKSDTVLNNRFIFNGIPMEDQHNIQTYENNVIDTMEEISHAIKEHRVQMRNVHQIIKKEKFKSGSPCCSIE